MIVGNQIYSRLSLLARQSVLMLTELSGMVTMFERFLQLEYSESYTCNMHGDARIEGYHYCMPLAILLALNYHSFILTVGIIGVAIYSIDGGDIKYLILMPEICMVTVIVKGHVYCWKFNPCIN